MASSARTPPMKVLVAHNRYVSANPSGENEVVDAEVQALGDAGVDVVTYLRSSDEIPHLPLHERLFVPFKPFRAQSAVRDVVALLERERVDVLHLHNPNPLISPAVISAAVRHGVPVVQTVH